MEGYLFKCVTALLRCVILDQSYLIYIELRLRLPFRRGIAVRAGNFLGVVGLEYFLWKFLRGRGVKKPLLILSFYQDLALGNYNRNDKIGKVNNNT